jgi:hypothetical protein
MTAVESGPAALGNARVVELDGMVFSGALTVVAYPFCS